jgi:hypothetical protein
MTDTYEYGYLHLIDTTSIRLPQVREWVGVVVTGEGQTVHGTGESALKILNELGQDGWMINDAPKLAVEDNRIPDYLTPTLYQAFQGLGVIHFLQTRYMTRRISWADRNDEV